MAKLSSTYIFGDLTVDGEILNKASVTGEGVVKLNNNTNSTSTSEAATANSVKVTYDYAAGKLTKAGDTMTGALKFTTAATVSDVDAPTQLGYGVLSGYGTMKVLANTDNTAGADNEYLHLATARGLSPTTSQGLVIYGTYATAFGTKKLTESNATNANTANAIVKRDGSGNFSAGTITATLSGNSSSATKLATARKINGVSFDGTGDITITAAPTSHTHQPSDIVQSASYRFVTDSEKSTWNAKASTAVVTTSANGLMSSSDKTKLNGIANNANNYSHPTGDGNLHIPATSTTNSGKFLMAGSTAGSVSWQAISTSTLGTYTKSEIDSKLSAKLDSSQVVTTATASKILKLDANGKLPADITGKAANSAQLDGKTAGNANGNIPVSNGTVCTNLNADKLDGYDAASFVLTSREVATGAGLTGGGNLTANRTIAVSFAGTGSATTVARSDHNHDTTYAKLSHTHDYSPSNHNHTYDVNNAWLREAGDNTNFKIFGNTRQVAFRTDGTTEYASGVGTYPFVWMYGGDASTNRLMATDTSGNIWTKSYGWLHSKFSSASHNHDTVYIKKSGDSMTGPLGFKSKFEINYNEQTETLDFNFIG